MSEPFIGQLMLAGFNFAPRGWALCNGQLLAIAQNTALFSLLGTTYGGNGFQTFGLPDLRGRVPVHFGQGTGLTNRVQGEQSGEESHTLITTEMPMHAHTPVATTGGATSDSPAGAVPAAGGAYGDTPDTTMTSVGLTGGNQPHNNMQPYLVLNWCIALEGIFPSRN